MLTCHLSVYLFRHLEHKAYSTASMIPFSIITVGARVCHGLDESAAASNSRHPLACLAHFVDLVSSLSHLLYR
jgi:hypothetical protein